MADNNYVYWSQYGLGEYAKEFAKLDIRNLDELKAVAPMLEEKYKLDGLCDHLGVPKPTKKQAPQPKSQPTPRQQKRDEKYKRIQKKIDKIIILLLIIMFVILFITYGKI